MSNELVMVPPSRVPAVVIETKLPELVERAGGAARFAWEEFFFAEHHNPHTQYAYESAARRPGVGGRAGCRTGEHFARDGWPVAGDPYSAGGWGSFVGSPIM